ncbi:amino acid permease [Salmonella enterica subsp. enterica]|uniref:Amino acid permease n=1 Tax=Salmonella enterica I TaxID=59201 RepID=A0A447PHP9_SALET|nr:amino acid permease [Salmonella enterica subsp. enterica]
MRRFATGNVDRFAEGNATNEAFFTIAGNVGGIWLKVAFSIIVAFVCAVGNIITAQTAVSRVLFSMGRDRMLPAFLAHVHTTRKTPDYAILFTGGVTLLLSYLFSGKIESISTLVNFGALFAFFVVNLCVFILFNFRMKAQRRIFAHVISPIMGMIVIGYVCLNMNIHALILGISWAAIGIAILCYRKAHNPKHRHRPGRQKVARLTLCATTPTVAQRRPCSGGVIASDIVNSVITNRCGSAQMSFETGFSFSFFVNFSV